MYEWKIKNYSWLISTTLLFFFIASGYIYGEKIHSSIVRNDEWRFIRLYLMPYYEGDFSLKMLFTDQHAGWFDGTIFILDAKFFELAGDLFFNIGMLSKGLVLACLLIAIKRSFYNNGFLFCIVFFLIGSIFFSLKAPVEYNWPLVTRFNFFLLIFIIILMRVEVALLTTLDKKNLLFIIVMIVLLLLSHRSAALIMMLSLISVLALYLMSNLITKRKIDKNLVVLFGLIFLAIMFYYLISYFVGVNKYSSVSSCDNLTCLQELSIDNLAKTFPIATLSGFIKIELLRQIIPSDKLFLLSYCIFAGYVFVFFLGLKKNIHITTIIPFVLMLYPLLFVLSVDLFRYVPNNNHFDWRIVSPRYIKTYELGVIGFVWLFIKICADYKKTFLNILLYFFALMFLAIYVYNVKTSIKMIPFYEKANDRAVNSLINYSGDRSEIPVWVLGGDFSEDKLLFLYQNELNVFSRRFELKNN